LEALSRLSQGTNFRFSSSSIDPHANVDFRPVLPGQTYTMADIKGPGTIRRIWLTILPSEPGYSRLMTLRIYWDGEEHPSVECPIGDFFGAGGGLDAVVDSLPARASADGKARSCFWVMPFRKSAKITLTNEGSLATWCLYYQVDGQYEQVAEDAAYFHAEYRQEYPCGPGNYVAADIHGKGQYVGTVLTVRSTADGWWGEGNDYFTVDGEQTPTLKGTGFEDYFGEAWGLRKVNSAYSGCSVLEDMVGGRASCYRWHVPDPIRFDKSLKVEFQDMGVGKNAKGEDANNIERSDEFSSAAFWYQLGPSTDYHPIVPGYDRLPFDYRKFVEAESLPYSNPGSGKVEVVKVNGLHGNHDLEWTGGRTGAELSLPFSVDQAGTYQVMVLVAKQSSGGIGRFFIDGKPVSDKYSFYEDGYDMHFEIPLEMRQLTAGKHRLTLRCQGKDSGTQGGPWFGIDGFIVQPLRK